MRGSSLPGLERRFPSFLSASYGEKQKLKNTACRRMSLRACYPLWG